MSKLEMDVFSIIWDIKSPMLASSGNVIVEAPPGPRSLARIVNFDSLVLGAARFDSLM